MTADEKSEQDLHTSEVVSDTWGRGSMYLRTEGCLCLCLWPRPITKRALIYSKNKTVPQNIQSQHKATWAAFEAELIESSSDKQNALFLILSFEYFTMQSPLYQGNPLFKGCGKGQQPQRWAGPRLILAASLNDVSWSFIHYSCIDWGDDSPRLDFPQRLHTGLCLCQPCLGCTAYLQGKKHQVCSLHNYSPL